MGAVMAGLVWWGYEYNFGFPSGATEESAITLHFWNGTWVAAFAVGILTWGLMLYASIAYRRRQGDGMPRQLRYNIPIEVMYTVTPIAMVLALVFFTVRDQAILTEVSNDQSETVEVTGFRWSWTFYYAEHDVYETGQPSLQEDQLPTLYLPVNEKVQFRLGSPDVIHSFWVPEFLFKMDVIPGRVNTFEVTPNELGTFAGKCAELCGVDHSRMLFNLKVVERAEFDAHMDELRALGQTGDPDSGRLTDAAQDVE
ncbi:MAG: cytochrome c oxidase subunit II [Actinobacteria bacterium]|nr:cytochrome c oxidase subunit II [Actinomycetota bacterium]MCB9412241.1 cytochrome c oxidase subunit II [Actinomycetota bacterium]